MDKKSIQRILVYGLAILLFPGVLFLAVPDIKGVEAGGTIQGSIKNPYLQRFPALIYVDQVKGEFPPPPQNVHISQKNMVFTPHITPILKGTTVDFTNDDSVAHNVFTPPGSATIFNLGIYGTGVTKTMKFNELGVSTLLCSVHPEMVAYVIALQNPYYAMTDNEGNFKIENVPAGSYQIKFWNEKLQADPQPAMVEAGKTTTVTFKDLKKK